MPNDIEKEGAIGFAQDLVKFDSRYKDVFGNVFGDTVIMESLREARLHLGKGRMVTLEGELLESGGVLGGSAPKTGIHFGTAERENIDDLANHVRALETEKLQLSSQVGELELPKGSFQTRVTDYDGRVEEVKKRLDEASDAVKST